MCLPTDRQSHSYGYRKVTNVGCILDAGITRQPVALSDLELNMILETTDRMLKPEGTRAMVS